MWLSKNIEETMKIAKKIAPKVKDGGIICLFGDLGSGKTTFTKGIAEYLGIESFKVKSPTYTYIRELNGNNGKNFFHIDLYRLEEMDDLLFEEISEIMEDKKNIIIIEWADRLKRELPENSCKIYFNYINEKERQITIED